MMNVPKQKDYQNVVNKPLLSAPPDETVLLTLGIPELHIMLGNSLKTICHLIPFI